MRFFGSALGLANKGIPPKGMPVKDYISGDDGGAYAIEMARSIDTVAATGCPLFQYVMTYWNGHAYHRLLLPVSDDGRRIVRVLGACVFPSDFCSHLVE